MIVAATLTGFVCGLIVGVVAALETFPENIWPPPPDLADSGEVFPSPAAARKWPSDA